MYDPGRGDPRMVDGGGDMLAVVRELSTDAHTQAQLMAGAMNAVVEMGGQARQMAAHAEAMVGVAGEASVIAHEGREAAEGAALGMVRVRDRTLGAARKIKRLGEMTQQISEIVHTVAQFADQTQLLSLNAAIEAERAGEQGRGFTLIAQQIRDLATNSSEAMRYISACIRALQQETSAIVTTIEESTRDVVEQYDLAVQAGTALGAVDGVGQRMLAGLGAIGERATQQARTAPEAIRALEEAAEIGLRARNTLGHLHHALERPGEAAYTASADPGTPRAHDASAAASPAAQAVAEYTAALPEPDLAGG